MRAAWSRLARHWSSERPVSLFVADFIGSPKMNLLTGVHAASFGSSTIGVRPEHLIVGRTEEGWPRTVLRIENLGSESYVYADIGSGEPMIARTLGIASFVQGYAVVLTANEGVVLRFDAGGNRI
jgi:multiple sugar transport system ATP-binding protein